MLDRKTIIDQEAAVTLTPLYNDFRRKISDLEKGLADFFIVVAL